MANRKISELGALTAPAGDDLIPVVDVSEGANANKNKKITYGELFKSVIDGTETAPAIAFDTAATTGFYKSAANELSIATNGGKAITVEANNKTTIFGDLVVTGGTTTVSSTTITVADKNIELATGNTSDAGATGGGLTIKAATDKTWNWIDSTDSWTSNQNIDLVSGMSYKIQANQVLTATTLGAGVVNSSLTSVGTLGALAVTNAITAGSLDISGGADIDGTLEADAITVDGTALNEFIADTVGAMVSSNTETNISVTYEDSDNTLDFVIGTLNQDTTGNAATATALQNARDIGGVSFDGTANINLPGVNQTGNQNTTGSAAKLTTARTIGGVSFDGSANINLPGVNAVGNQNTSGTAAGLSGTPDITVDDIVAASLDISGNADIDGTLEADAYTVNGVALNEFIADTVGAMVSSNTETNITVTYQDSDNTLDFVIGTLNQDTTGNAATATALQTARTIGGVSFDGTANINLPGVNTAGNQNTSGTAANLSGTPSITVADVVAASLDISGNVDIDGTLETDALTINGTSLAETISDTVGAMVTSNTETGISVTYDDADNTLDFVVGTLNQDTTGNAATATALQTARTIGGTSFDGTANITPANATNAVNLSGTIASGVTGTTQSASDNSTKIATTAYVTSAVSNLIDSAPGALDTLNELAAAIGDDANFSTTITNSLATKLPLAGGTMTGAINLGSNNITNGGTITGTFVGNITGNVTGNTSGSSGSCTGNAATATQLATARTIGGVSFDGTSNINLPGVNAVGNQNTTGSAATLTTARTIGGVSFNGSANIDLPGVNTAGNQNTSGNAATATALATARAINGVNFDGTAAITVAAAAGTLTGNTLASGVTASSLTSVGTLTGLTVSGNALFTSTGCIRVSAGTTAQRPGSPAVGDFRYNSTEAEFEGYTASGWGAIAGGGGASNFQYLALRNAANNGAASYPAADFTLVTSGTTNAVSPAAANVLLVSVAGVIQQPNTGTSTPTTGFAISGSTIKFGSNISAAPDFIIYQVGAGVGTPSDNTVDVAHLAHSTQGELLYYGASGVPAKLSAGTSGHYLKTQGSGANPVWAAIPAGVGGATGVDFNDTVKVRFGNGNDLEIYHNGASNWIDSVNNSALILRAGTGDAYLQGNNLYLGDEGANEKYIDCHKDAAVELYYDNSRKFSTYSGGVEITGTLWIPDGSSSGNRISVGNSGDLLIYHDGSHSRIHNVTGNLDFRASGYRFNNSSGTENCLDIDHNAAVSLYYDHSKKLETTSVGMRLSGNYQANDGYHIYLGTGNDIDLYHDGSNTFASNSTGYFFIQSNNLALRSVGQENYLVATANGAVELYYDNSKRFHTTSSGAQLSGHLFMDDDNKVQLGSSQDLQIWHSGSFGRILNANDDLYVDAINHFIRSDGGNDNAVVCRQNAAVELYYDNSKKFETAGGGVNVTGDVYHLTDNGSAYFGAGNDLRIYHDGSNSRINNTHTGTFFFDTAGEFQLRSTSTEKFIRATQNGQVELFYNNYRAFFTDPNGAVVIGPEGGSGNLYLYGDEGDDNNDKWVFIAGGGEFTLQNFASGSWEKNILCNGNGAVELYYDNSKKLNTKSDGVLISGEASVNGHLMMNHADSHKIYLGAGNDLQIYHDGSTGIFECTNSNLSIRPKTGENGILIQANGSVSLYCDDAKKFETTSSGATCTGWLQGTQVYATDYIKVSDNDRYYAGNDNDLEIFHDGSNAYFKEVDSGEFRFYQNSVEAWRLDNNNIWHKRHTLPWTNNSYNLGSSSYRWANLYVNDAHFSNEGSSNSVDGTWGDWTLQEGEEDIFMINNRSGKKYRMALQEVS